MPMLRVNSILVPKIETTPGTAISVTPSSDGAMNVYNFKWTPPNTKDVRKSQLGFYKLAAVPKGKMVKFTFSTDFVGGSAGVPLWASVLLPMAAYPNATGTFGPAASPSSQKTGTHVFYQDGKKHTFAGCMGNAKLTIVNGGRGVTEWEFTGKYMGSADTALPTAPTWPTTIPPVGTVSATYGSYVPITDKIVIDLGCKITLMPSVINDANNTGFAYAVVSDSDPTIEISPNEELVAVQDWDGAWAASSLATFACVVGTASNNTWTITAASAEVMDPGGYDEREGVVTRAVKLNVNGSLTLVNS